MPLVPRLPEDALDPDWSTGLDRAVASGLVFGRDIVFTYGPYAAVATRFVDPDVRWLALGGGAVLALAAVACVLPLLRAHPRLAWTVCTVLVLGLVTTDADQLLVPLVIALRFAMATRSGAPPPLATTVVSALALGLLPLVKLSAVPCVVVVLLVALVLAVRGHWWTTAAALVVVAPVGSVALWALAGQPVGALPDYLGTLGPITDTYSEAMSTVITSSEMLAAALFLLATLVALESLRRQLVDLPAVLVAVVLLACLFLGWKSSFVRTGTHVVSSVGVLLAVAVLALAIGARGLRRPLLVAVVALGTLTSALAYQRDGDGGHTARAVRATVLQSPVEAVRLVTDPGSLGRRYRAALGDVVAGGQIRSVDGTVDVYPVGQTQVLANEMHWDPRPTFQSYAAYNAELAGRNAAHLRGSGAPDHLFVSVRTIDERWANLDDGPSLLAMLERYDVAADGSTDRFVRLDRKPRPAPLDEGPTTRQTARIGQRLDLPSPTSSYRVATIDVRPSRIGGVLNLLWRPATLLIAVTTADGVDHVHRFIPSTAREPFLLSPYVADTADLGRVLAGDADPSSTVTAIRITGGRSSWQPEISVALRDVQAG